MRVLVVDDDPVYADALGAIAEDRGHEVVAVTSSPEADQRIVQAAPDIMLTDWVMPEVSGLDLCRRVRATRPTTAHYTYIVLVTANDAKTEILEAMEAGVDDFVAKPVDFDLLSARLGIAERVLSVRAELAQLQSMLPICMMCHKIRDEGERWQKLEKYIGDRTGAIFSHGVCPDCLPKFENS